jgi:DNA-binding NtrC family response regulator
MPSAARILLVDDDLTLLNSFGRILRMQGYDVVTAPDGEGALRAADGPPYDLALVDYELPDMNGAELTTRLVELDPNLFVIGFTGKGDGSIGFEMLQSGARQYIEKGSMARPDQALFRTIREFVHISRAERAEEQDDEDEVNADPYIRKGLSTLLGKSQAMADFKRDLIDIAEAGPRVVLLLGESGVGKSHAARALHAAWGRSRDRVVEVNCAALNRERIGPILFGTEKGSFTSVETKRGALGEAGRGTLFLDEFGLLDGEVQAQLLTLLQEWTYSRVGSVKTESYEGRIICATNEDLAGAVKERTFRKDLYYRINRFTLRVPALRERPEDIALLAYRFLDRYSKEYGRPVRHIPQETLRLLQTHSWRQNNVRELENVISSAVARCRRRYLEPRYLRFEQGHDPVGPEADPPAGGGGGLERGFSELFDGPYTPAKAELVKRFTQEYCLHQLARANGNKTLAAEYSGMQRPNFYKLLSKYEVDTSRLDDRDLRGGKDG